MRLRHRDFVSRYKQTVLGSACYIIQPLFTSLMITLFFNKIAKISTGEIPPVLFFLAGMALTLAITGPGFGTILAAFFAFRFFDILKPGIHWIENSGWCGIIVWDDLLAGLYAGVGVSILRVATS